MCILRYTHVYTYMSIVNCIPNPGDSWVLSTEFVFRFKFIDTSELRWSPVYLVDETWSYREVSIEQK